LLLAGPGSDFSEVPAVGIEPAALDCRVAPMCPPGPVPDRLASLTTSFLFTTHLLDTGIDASAGTVGDALDNALMESTIGLYKTELIKPRGPWRSIVDVELATAEWVNWYNAKRPHSAIGHIPPDEHEARYYAQLLLHEVAGVNC
jgi:transposase InsO family protein